MIVPYRSQLCALDSGFWILDSGFWIWNFGRELWNGRYIVEITKNKKRWVHFLQDKNRPKLEHLLDMCFSRFDSSFYTVQTILEQLITMGRIFFVRPVHNGSWKKYLTKIVTPPSPTIWNGIYGLTISYNIKTNI